jgi:topoisomerase-4 subunit A
MLNPEEKQDLILVTHRGAAKKMRLQEFETGSRAKRGVIMLREIKSNPHRVVAVVSSTGKDEVLLVTAKGVRLTIAVNNLKPVDRYSNGSFVLDEGTDGRVEAVYKKDETGKEI